MNSTQRLSVALLLALGLAAFTAGKVATAQVARVDGYQGTLANVDGLVGTTVRIDLVQWSTDEDREDLVAAIVGYAENLVAHEEWVAAREAEETADAEAAAAEAAAAEAEARGEAPPEVAEGRGRGDGDGRGGRAGGRGAAEAEEEEEAEEAEEEEEAKEEEEPEPEPDPLGDFFAALDDLGTAGVLWAGTSSGYTIKFAYSEPLPEGGERVILVTDSPLGSHRFRGWPTAEGPEEYIYSLIELRIPAGGVGEGKTSLSAGIAIDPEANTIGLDDYGAAPVHMEDVTLAPPGN